MSSADAEAVNAAIERRPGLLGAWLRGASKFEHFLEDRFERLGVMVGNRPKTVIAIVMVFSLIGLSGFTQLDVEARGDRLWTPQNSIAVAHREYVRSVETFGAPPRLEEVMLISRQPSTNMASKAAVDAMMDLWSSLLALQVDRGADQSPDNLENLCVRLTLPSGASGDCLLLDSIINFWSANKTLFDTTVSTEAEVLTTVSASTFPDGRSVNRVNTFGLLQTDASTGNVAFTQAINLNFLLKEELEDRGKDWEQAAIDFLFQKRDEMDEANSPFVLTFRLQRSLDDELLRSVSGDIPLLVATYTLMSVFVCFTLGKFHRVNGRVTLSLQGILMIVFGTGASFGFCSWLGVKFISLHQILPFILVGIGVDDMYIIVAAFNVTNKKWGLPKRMGYTMRQAGVTVTVTSLTNAMAFALGSTSITPAVEYFCQYASLSIMIIYSFGMTAFCAMLVLDEQRRLDHRLDCCCCCFTSAVSLAEAKEEEEAKREARSQKPSERLEMVDVKKSSAAPALQSPTTSSTQDLQVSGPVDSKLIEVLDTAGTMVKVNPKPEDIAHERSVTDSWSPNTPSKHLSVSARWMRDKYGPWLLDPRNKIFVIVAFVGFLALNIYWVTQLTQGFELVDVVPDNSYVRDYFEAEDNYFPDKQLALTLYFRDLSYHTQVTQQEIETFTNQMLASQWTTGPVISWLTAFQAYYRSTAPYNASLTNNYLTDKTTFYTALNAFLQDPNALIFNSNIHWSDSSRTLVTSSRIGLFHVPFRDTEQRKDVLLSLRDLSLSSPLNAGDGGKDAHAFPYSPFYVFFESFVTIYQELIVNFLLSGVAVVAICLVLLAHPGSIPFLVIVIGIIDVDLLGGIYMWGLQINSVTAIQLVMATGLIVDYSAHVTHSFLKHTGSRDERVAKALTSMGSSIIMGGTTSFLGVVPLVFSNSTIFRTFFRMFFCIVVYGIVHGLVLLPVLLSYAGPELVPHEDPTEKIEAQKAMDMGKADVVDNNDTIVEEDNIAV